MTSINQRDIFSFSPKLPPYIHIPDCQELDAMELPISYQSSPLDQTMPPIYYAIILAFPVQLAHREYALTALQNGYSRLLQERPYLAGDIVRLDSPGVRPGSLKLTVPNPLPSIKLDVADLSESPEFKGYSYPSMCKAGMPPSLLNAELLAPYVGGPANTTKVLTGRVNWIEGGCLLAISASHAALDAQGTFMVMKSWAQLCQPEVSPEIRSCPHSQRWKTEVKTAGGRLMIQGTASSQKPYEGLKSRPELWNLLGLHSEDNLAPPTASLPTCIPGAPGEVPGVRNCLFCFSVQDAAALKAAATPQASRGWISTQDACSAHIWTSLMRARFPDHDISVSNGRLNEDSDEPLSSMNVAIDGRRIPGYHFAPSRINNTIYCCQPQLPLSMILERDNLPLIAGTIRQKIEAVKSDQDLINDANALAAAIPNVGNLTFVFKDFMGIDFVTTSWTDLPYYDLDFGPGLGKPDFFRMPRNQFTGACCMLPRRPNGDIEVVVSGRVEEIGRLLKDTNFLKYAKFVGG
ncbi:hypothetical protein F5Y07DRAFT_357802 [Xylaria sp. FL0933]|nr:hypothetical protein F5Y07DRAFT_357802 [Xylaria sp. FL0933]